MKDVSEILREKRRLLGITKSELGRKLNISSQLLGHYESGKSKPKPDFYLKWKSVFGEDLLSEVYSKDLTGKKNLIGDNIRALRIAHWHSVDEWYSEKIGIAIQTLSEIEDGLKMP